MVGPFVLLDQLGPVEFDSGQGFDLAAHPHLGIAKLTYLVDGAMVYRDSHGQAQTIRAGEVNWMVSGSGIVHSERTPSEIRVPGGNLFGIQAWVALPSQYEEAAPSIANYDVSRVPRTCARGIELTLIAGSSDGLVSPVSTYSDMLLAEIVLTSGTRYQVKSHHLERAIFVVTGEIEIAGQQGTIGQSELLFLQPGAELVVCAPAFHAARLLLIGGEPLTEPRYMYWNFVSSSAERIEQAKIEWREQRFPTVPGEAEFIPLPEDQ
jgi:redox-sensitive bicupin YhaK (pirin superfamily)